MAQQRISFSIATHPPVHPPVASPADSAGKVAPNTTSTEKSASGNGHAGNGHAEAAKSAESAAKEKSRIEAMRSEHRNAAKKRREARRAAAEARTAAKSGTDDTAAVDHQTNHSSEKPASGKPKAAGENGAKRNGVEHHGAKPANGPDIETPAAPLNGIRAEPAPQATRGAAHQTSDHKPQRPEPKAGAKAITAKETPKRAPAMPAIAAKPASVGRRLPVMAGAFGLAITAALVAGTAWIESSTYRPLEASLAAGDAFAPNRIAPAAGRQSSLNASQLLTLSERLADVEHATYRKRYTRTIKIGRGDRLLQLLILEGVPRREAFNAIQVLSKVYQLRRLRAGQRVELVYGIINHQPQSFVGLRFELGNGAREISVIRHGKGPFTATDVKKQLQPQLVRGTGRIETSLYVAGLKAGVPPAVMIQLIQIYSFDVDFQREIRKGDAFSVMFRNYRDEEGKLVRQGDIIYASLTLRGTELELYRFTPRNGHTDYFNPNGHSVRKALMRTPIDGARLTSGFGRRRHPVLGYTKVHTGIDFAAPPGTPIYAAGDGIIVTRKRAGGYGNYIKIRHTSNYQTAYAHMQRFAFGLGVGSRVRQGQVIGYVGSSGLVTGPHLHYEVHYNGRPVNPMGLRLATGQKLKGLDLREFLVRRTLVNNMFLSRAKDVRVAAARQR